MKLNPCPFCGYGNIRPMKEDPLRGSYTQRYWMECGSMQCATAGPRAITRREAVKKWQTRNHGGIQS